MMNRPFGYLVTSVAIVLAAPVAAHPPEKHAVEKVMNDSAAGWNSGDINQFMAVYSDGPETSFVTKEGVLRGKAVMSERYRTKYDFANAAKRGVLTFETLDFRLLDPTHAIYIGRYTLTYTDGKTQSGPTSLVFAKETGGWKIIADHSS
ncbi:MAG: DUF4440 domain-containing protein [Sphingomonas sp. 28-62-11]|nr:MAG: DUF4440 domain-containing protein [Sphingomonas sp. 28-62-11]